MSSNQYHVAHSASATEPSFPAFDEVDGVDPYNHPEPFVRAPWFRPFFYRDAALVRRYQTGTNLPGRVPIRAIDSADWGLHFVLADRDVLRHSGESMHAARIELVRVLHKRLHRVANDLPVPEHLGLDTWFFRTHGERLLGPYYGEEPPLPNEGDIFKPHADALFYERPILRADFRHRRRGSQHHFARDVKWERTARTRTGYLVPYQCVEIDRIHPRARPSRYVPIPSFWEEWESPRGATVELPAVLTYLGSILIDNPLSTWWDVVLTEWSAQYAAFLIWEAYDRHKLWYVPPRVLAAWGSIDLSFVLGSNRNYAELLKLADVVKAINWAAVPASQAHRGSRQVDHSPGRSAPSGDFIWYEPWGRGPCSMAEAREATRYRGLTPLGYPDRFEFVREGAWPIYDQEAAQGAPDVAHAPPAAAAAAAPIAPAVPPAQDVPVNPPAPAPVAAPAASSPHVAADATMTDVAEAPAASSGGSSPSKANRGPDRAALNSFLRGAGVPNPSAETWEQALSLLRGHMASVSTPTAPAAVPAPTVVTEVAPMPPPSTGGAAAVPTSVGPSSVAAPVAASPIIQVVAIPASFVLSPDAAAAVAGPAPAQPPPVPAAASSVAGSAVTPGAVSDDDSLDCAAIEQLTAPAVAGVAASANAPSVVAPSGERAAEDASR